MHTNTSELLSHEQTIKIVDFLTHQAWPSEFERIIGRLPKGWHYVRWTPPSLKELLNGATGTVTQGIEPSPFYPEAEFFKLGNHPVTIWQSIGGTRNDLHWSNCMLEEVPRHHAEYFIKDMNDSESEFCHIHPETITRSEQDMLRKGGVYVRRTDILYPDHMLEDLSISILPIVQQTLETGKIEQQWPNEP